MTENARHTLPQWLRHNYEEIPEKLALRFKDLGIWKTYTWADYYTHVRNFAHGLASLGFGRGDKVGIIGENQPPWYWGELASQALGGVCVGIFVDAVPSEIKYILEHSDASVVIAHDQEQVDKVLEIRDELPLLKKIIYWDEKGLWFYDDPLLASFAQVEALGHDYEKDHPRHVEEHIARGTGDDCAVICYTSGTTGLPKGANAQPPDPDRNQKGLVRNRPVFRGRQLPFLSLARVGHRAVPGCGGRFFVQIRGSIPPKPRKPSRGTSGKSNRACSFTGPANGKASTP